ncbi:MAG TPA: hypothetical protein VFS23_34730 [Vicinamibacterales bacterium]|nr:hypothetical protein [Vicinamibacterales bacterium]
MATLCLVTTLAGTAPFLPIDRSTTQIAYGFSVFVAAGVVGGLTLYARVPRRTVVQSNADYWSMTNAGSAATLTWFVLEGAAIVGGIGYLLTADPVVTMVSCAAIAAFGWCNPRQCAKQ